MNDSDYCGAVKARTPGGPRGACCYNEGINSYGDCDDAKRPEGPAFSDVALFATSETKWLESYMKAWKIATTNG